MTAESNAKPPDQLPHPWATDAAAIVAPDATFPAFACRGYDGAAGFCLSEATLNRQLRDLTRWARYLAKSRFRSIEFRGRAPLDSLGAQTNFRRVVADDATCCFAALIDGEPGIRMSFDGGSSWTGQFPAVEPSGFVASPTDPIPAIDFGPPGVIGAAVNLITTGGAAVPVVGFQTYNCDSPGGVPDVDLVVIGFGSPVGHDVAYFPTTGVWFVATSQGLYQVDGSTVTLAHADEIFCVKTCDTGTVIAASAAGLLRSTDGGITWALISGVTDVTAMACDGQNWIALRGGAAPSVVASTNDGNTWVTVDTGNTAIAPFVCGGVMGFISSEIGGCTAVRVSCDGGATFEHGAKLGTEAAFSLLTSKADTLCGRPLIALGPALFELPL